jgi:hypothetical protein
MEPTLDEAIQSVFGTLQPPAISAPAPGAQPALGQARAQFDDAQKAMQQGNWGDFGKIDGCAEALAGRASANANRDPPITRLSIKEGTTHDSIHL